MTSVWWRDLCDLFEGGSGSGAHWFNDVVGHRISNDGNTYFWSNLWLEAGVMQDRFRRLFEISVDRNV